MKCPVCKSRIKTMYKPDKQYHCRGRCGLIIRFGNADPKDYEDITNLFDRSDNSDYAKCVEEIKTCLEGIDCDGGDGWWETSTGAEFGEKKLQQVLSILETHYDR